MGALLTGLVELKLCQEGSADGSWRAYELDADLSQLVSMKTTHIISGTIIQALGPFILFPEIIAHVMLNTHKSKYLEMKTRTKTFTNHCTGSPLLHFAFISATILLYFNAVFDCIFYLQHNSWELFCICNESVLISSPEIHLVEKFVLFFFICIVVLISVSVPATCHILQVGGVAYQCDIVCKEKQVSAWNVG